MTTHRTGTREEWLRARVELLQAEKALTHRSDEVARMRQELPCVRIEKTYRFDTDHGNVSMRDLFRGRSQLLIYHFMFGPDYRRRPMRRILRMEPPSSPGCQGPTRRPIFASGRG